MDNVAIKEIQICPYCREEVRHTYCQYCYARKILPEKVWEGLSEYEKKVGWVAKYTQAIKKGGKE